MPAVPNKAKTKRSPFSGYRAYVSRLQVLMNESNQGPDWNKQVDAALNGQASVELRRVAPLKTRRKYGAYFTGTILSERLLKRCQSFDNECVFYDPTCGMGDLLLAAAKNLPLGNTLSETLTMWGRRLAGSDLHSEFIEGAKTRLVLLARQRHQISAPLVIFPSKIFPHIKIVNGLDEKGAFLRAKTILMNPPFGLAKAPSDCGWAGGRISEAANFMITALERTRPGTEVLAILPEVLRSGSFSERWRSQISELAEVHLIQPYGIFDDSADVDVFLLRLVRRAKGKSTPRMKWPARRSTLKTTVTDYFDVHVGRVVPHRDLEVGQRHPYIHPRCVPTWTIMRKFAETRKYEGLVYAPPFVVIRRTSRPGHPYRATATIIAGKKPVAVENHLIVCEPKDGKLATCKELMRQLKTEIVNSYLNARIRCRHLTTGAVMGIPFTPLAQ